MKNTKYICCEGVDGVGKSTQVDLLVQHLRREGFLVLQTKEPGTPHAPLTMTLRSLVLDSAFENELTIPARELLTQAIRSIHLEKVIIPSFGVYDYIIQDRGVLSGLAYGAAIGNSIEWLESLVSGICHGLWAAPYGMYDQVIVLERDIAKSLIAAGNSKAEFATGDIIEKRGVEFMQSVSKHMHTYSAWFNTAILHCDEKDVQQVHEDILNIVGRINDR